MLLLAALKLALQCQAGLEYDTNANRAEIVAGVPLDVQDQPTGSFLLRLTTRGSLAWRSGRNMLRATAGLGGKVFFDPSVQDQDVLVGQLAVEDRVRPIDRLELGAAAEYYDAGQLDVTPPCASIGCSRHRDFRTGQVTARIAFLDEHGELAAWGGWRGFQYKPDSTFDFQAGQAHLLALARLEAGPPDREVDLDLSAQYHVERRFYDSPVEVNVCPPGKPIDASCLVAGGGSRDDWFHEGAVDLTVVGKALFTIGYALQLNLSNSFGQSLLRHVIAAKLGFRLPWQLYATLKGQLLITRYFDPVLLDRAVNTQTFVSIEDENRNAFIADLERPIGRGLSVEARYSIFTNEIAPSPVSFLRQVVYVGVAYKIGTR